MDPVVYVIDGSRISSLDDAFELIGEAVGGPGTYFGKNLDALSDCLVGGYGTPEDRRFRFVLEHSEIARAALGYEETLTWLRQKLLICHPSNVDVVQSEIDAAAAKRGATIFDILLEVFRDREVPLDLR